MMNFDFALILTLLTLAAGIAWLVDALFLAKKRQHLVMQYLGAQHIDAADFQHYLDHLDESRPEEKRADANAGEGDVPGRLDPGRERAFEQAWLLFREPVAVEYAKSFFPILFVVLVLRSFVFEPFQIPSPSMVPTLNVGDYILVNKFAYGLRLPVIGTKIIETGEPKRGDVMVFVPPHDPRYFIKRVIGLPGDHVRFEDNIVYINGEPLPQEEGGYMPGSGIKLSLETIGGLTHAIHTDPLRFSHSYRWRDASGAIRDGWLDPAGMVVPQGHYFMMGDNRDDSEDSRYWGPASEANIVGKAVAVWMHREPGWNLPDFGQSRWIQNAP
jgi:signal peptidase I